MPKNNSKKARVERKKRALVRAKGDLANYVAGIFRPDQNTSYNPSFSADNAIEKCKTTIVNTENNLPEYPY